jgi:2-polyprenyl-3-methyl-5-hydroxy-6-metoxy-1,4-benzoquinol methylase
MKLPIFRTYRRTMETYFQKLGDKKPGELAEQAIPSYTHRNRLMAWLFWERIYKVICYVESIRVNRVLDFGCGAGPLLPFLDGACTQVYAYDLNPDPAQRTIDTFLLKKTTLFTVEGGVGQLGNKSVDLIIALDVLEHVAELESLLKEFRRILTDNGRFIVCGPTESCLYKIGRRMAGFENLYHKRSIYDIEREMREFFDVRVIARMYPPVTLFRISSASRKAAKK